MVLGGQGLLFDVWLQWGLNYSGGLVRRGREFDRISILVGDLVEAVDGCMLFWRFVVNWFLFFGDGNNISFLGVRPESRMGVYSLVK